MYIITKLIFKNLVKGLPKFKVDFEHIYDSCQFGKQTRKRFKSQNMVSNSRSLEQLHMDLFGPTRTTSLGGIKYGLMILDDFSIFTWILFIAHKDEAFKVFQIFYKKFSN